MSQAVVENLLLVEVVELGFLVLGKKIFELVERNWSGLGASTTVFPYSCPYTKRGERRGCRVWNSLSKPPKPSTVVSSKEWTISRRRGGGRRA